MKKRTVAFVLAAAMLASMSVSVAAEEKQEITWLGYYTSEIPVTENSWAEQILEQEFGVDITPITDVTQENMDVFISSGELINVTCFDYYLTLASGGSGSKVQYLYDQGMIREIPVEWLYEYYPTGMKIYSEWLGADYFEKGENLIDGKCLYTPYVEGHTISTSSLVYRKDWMENLGMSEPTTLDELHDLLYAFTYNDPDGNGKDDTYGMSPYGETFYLNPLYHAFGVTPDYDIDDNNEATYMYLQPEFKEFLSWFNQMYENGYIDPQFAANKDNMDREKFFDGTVGILITNAEQHVTWIADAFENSNGKGLLTFGDAPVGTKTLGKEGASGFSDWGGWWGGYSILKDCQDPHAVLRLFNYLYSPEGSALRSYGIENYHYSIENNEIVPLIDGRNEEPDNTFTNNKSIDGYSLPTGYYKFGTAFCNNLSWSEDLKTVSAKIEPKLIDSTYSDLIQLGIEKNKLCSSKLTNVTGFYSSYTTKMNRIEDETSTYAINVIMGRSNLTSDYEALLTKLDGKSFDWKNVKKMIEEVASNAGII